MVDQENAQVVPPFGTQNMKRLLIAVMALCASTASAQKVPKDTAKSCDPKSALLNSPTSFGVQRPTIVKACWSFQQGVENFKAANLVTLRAMTGEQAINQLLHASLVWPIPPKDTAVVPPVIIVPVPVDSTPKDTTTPPVVTPPAVSVWTGVHYAAGARYLISGYRRARWTYADTTKAVYTYIDGDLQCGFSGFDGKAPSGSGNSYCEISSPLLDTIAVPVPMGPITGKTFIVPRGGPGFSTARVQSGGGDGTPSTDGFGAFRTTCTLAKILFDDPIVAPGKPGASHAHQFFGLANVDAFTDTVSLKKGASTCRGGTLNQTAYWSPVMVDARGNAVLPASLVAYYKSFVLGNPALTQVIPMGLRMVAGSKLATGPQFSPDGLLQIVDWSCLRGTAKSPNNATIPACAKGDTVRMTVYFPSCWNAKDLDSPDHQGHMGYPDHRGKVATCDAAHPVQLPEISEHFDWESDGNVGAWRLSSDMDASKPGISGHADWLMGWSSDIMQSIVANCIQKRIDCGVGGVGGNRTLY